MKRIALLAAGILACCGLQIGRAQVANESLANQIIAARQKNAALMKQYSWNSRTELLDNGAVKDIRIEQVMFGPDGKLQRTLLNDQPASQPRGFLRRRIADHEKEEIEKYLTGLRGLLDKYTQSTAGKIIDFISTAVIQPPDANKVSQITGSSVVIPGDTLSLMVSSQTHATRSMKIMTFFESDEVNVSVTFKTLTSGLTYAAFGEVDVPTKHLTLQLQNYDYINQNQ
jgi:hypothetical protein